MATTRRFYEVPVERAIQIASETNALLMTLLIDRRLDRTNPAASPRPLFFACDFVRRTYLEYVIPILPADAPYKSMALTNPFCFDYGGDNVPGPSFKEDLAYMQDVANWGAWDAGKDEKLQDAMTRNFMIMTIIDEAETEGSKGAMLLGSTFDFGESVKGLVAAIQNGDFSDEWEDDEDDDGDGH